MGARVRIHHPDTSFRRTVHLSDVKRAELTLRLDDLARKAQLFDGVDADEAEQRPLNFRVTVHHPGGGSARFLIFSRNYGPMGMWFLHSGFLNPGTHCVFILPRGDDQEGGVMGVVERCELLERNIHAVGIRFESEIDPQLLLPGKRAAPSAAPASDSVELPKLDARVLLLDDQPADRELLAFHLRSTGVKLSCRHRLEDALDAIRHERFDLLVCELNLADGPGEQAIRLLRHRGLEAPVIVLTAEDSADRRDAAKRAGARVVISKPYDPAQLIHVIAGVLEEGRAKGREAEARREAALPIYSSLGHDGAMVPLIESYLTQVKRTLSELANAIREDDLASVRRLCLAIKGSGTGYGFEPLGTAAANAVVKLDKSSSIPDSLEHLNTLHAVGRRLALKPDDE